MTRVLVIGGGVSGLAAAFRIRQTVPTAGVTLLEARPVVGGAIGTDRRDGFTIERGPNGLFDNNPAALHLCRDAGLGERLLPASEGSRKNRYLLLNEKLHRLPGDPLGLLFTPVLSLGGKLALLGEPFRKAKDLPDESVAAFARRRFGKEAADTFMDALVTGIHAGDPEKLSVRAAFPRLPRYEAEAGSVMKGMIRNAKQRKWDALARGETPSPQRLWSFREGLDVLPAALAASLGDRVRTGMSATRLERVENHWRVTAGGETFDADQVVLTTPAYHQAELLADIAPALAADIAAIRYNAIAVVALGYRTEHAPINPDGFGYIAPQRTRRDVLGVQWCSSVYPDRAPPGFVLWRALCGGVNRADVASLLDDELLKVVHREMTIAMKVTAEPAFHHIVRWPRAIPQYELGHLERVNRVEERLAALPGLTLGGNCYRGVALGDCADDARRIARRVARIMPA